MTEIILAHDSSDRERVRPFRDALAAQGFDVRWDLEPPAGVEWERWVHRRIARSKCVVVLRSASSVHSNRMSHVEAVAKDHGKLVLVRLEPRSSWAAQAQVQAAAADGLDLAGWSGDLDHPGWQELCRQIEGRLEASLWVQRLIHGLEMERTRWRAQYEASAARCKSLHDELAHERSERGAAQDGIAGLQARLDADGKARSRLEARIVELEQRLARAEETHAESGQLLREELRQKDALLTEAQVAMVREQHEAARLRTELAAMEDVHGELRSRLARHETTLQAREGHIVHLDATVAQREADIAGLKVALAERDAGIARLEAAVAQRDADIAGLTAAVAERDSSLASLNADLAERDGRIAGVKAGIAGLEADIAERDSYIADLMASVTQRDTYIGDLRASLPDRRAYMADLEASIAQRDTHIADLKAVLAERDARIAGLTASLEELKRRRWGGIAAMPLPAALSRMTRPVLDRLGSR